ncbi:hypothetical protein ADK67_36885 [Saccharothrix sp. NRRL B-16348]|uniref:hypothetical protein n=1 Tax=Saccharothrix sp. NRRL B-16348 TaxID=1415542 RepID=UPI0006ADD9B0|nr:hypothetical protein [Saccharothrix sp. NRRL B-16348]KOX18463.1 hypothetical protein ADK67_36885 [Saccharothrix sp. NRRL B-16348]
MITALGIAEVNLQWPGLALAFIRRLVVLDGGVVALVVRSGRRGRERVMPHREYWQGPRCHRP